MALGAVEAARAAGKDKVVVIGVDGTQSALKSIRAGRLNASVAQLPYLMGMRAVEESKKALAGEKVPQLVDVPTLVLTKDIIEANKNPMLQYAK
jgi:D-allose transport system substrate-binding protein